jgi:hypothetical protein
MGAPSPKPCPFVLNDNAVLTGELMMEKKNSRKKKDRKEER